MSDIQISTYREPRWGSRALGTATVRKDSQEHYSLNDVGVANLRVVGLFTVVTCVDDTTHNVLTAFFKLVDRQAKPE